MKELPLDPSDIVQSGYNSMARAYHEKRKAGSMSWFEEFIPLFKGKRILDAGCGAGVPTTKFFADRDFQVTGIDVSGEMLKIARAEVPKATFIEANLVKLLFENSSFDVVISMFAIIHVLREHHTAVLKEFNRVLTPEGILIVSMGVNDNPEEIREDWYGTRMFWSHFDQATSIRLVEDAGFVIIKSEIAATRSGEEHLFIVAKRGVINPHRAR
jgi:ubiquinone/menaquinone biosynthesis C-methylase UbiE